MLKTGLCLLFMALPSLAWVPQEEPGLQNERPDAIEGVGIVEQLDKDLDRATPLVAEDGSTVSLAQYLGKPRPVVLSMVYFSCPSMCNLHLNGVFDVFKDLNLVPGKDFEFVAVSIDGSETPDVAQAKKETYLENYGLEAAAAGIHFLTGTAANVKKVADSVGFSYKWIEEKKEWAHASAATLVTPEGKISRYLHGVFFNPQTFRLSLVETSAGKIGSLVDRFTLYCFRYDPKSSKYSFLIFNVMRGFALMLLLFLMIWVGAFWWRNRKMSRQV